GWAATQWNFSGPFSVNAPAAWQHAIDAGAPGARGVTIAVHDTGVAYARRGAYRKSPDLVGTHFVRGYDFVSGDAYANDRNAHRHGVSLVGASGNEAHRSVAFPARARYVVSVGATTVHGCLSDFSNQGEGLDITAPGGGADAVIDGDPNCHPADRPGRDIFQVTLEGGAQNRRFGIPGGYEGTSMAAPHVAAA